MPFVKAHLKYSDIELMKLFKDYDLLINKKILFIQTYDKHKYIFYNFLLPIALIYNDLYKRYIKFIQLHNKPKIQEAIAITSFDDSGNNDNEISLNTQLLSNTEQQEATKRQSKENNNNNVTMNTNNNMSCNLEFLNVSSMNCTENNLDYSIN